MLPKDRMDADAQELLGRIADSAKKLVHRMTALNHQVVSFVANDDGMDKAV